MARTNYPTGEMFATRVLRTKGPGPLADVDELLQAVIPVDREGPYEFHGPQGIRSFSRALTVSGVAGQYGYLVLFNGFAQLAGTNLGGPGNLILVVERMQSSAAYAIHGGLFPLAWYFMWPGWVTTGVGLPRDFRFPNQGQGMLISGNDAATSLTAQATQYWNTYRFATTNQEIDTPFVIPPGFGLVMRVGIAATFDAHFQWSERESF